ncbi:MAG TPA: glycosyltransferase family 4 protein [Tepidisphaeraceae bacterium]|nr:glycosyltransferase family 4 protein [Tepidisphaeraceae bacterium]
MRLTLINQFYIPDISPTAHLCASLAEHRAGRGDEVTVLTSGTGYVAPIGGATDDRNVRVRRLWATGFDNQRNLGRLLNWGTFYLRAIAAAAALPRQDVIIAMTTPPFVVIAGIIHKLLHPSVKLILWNMDCYPEVLERSGMARPGGWMGRFLRALNRAIFRRLEHLICLDRGMTDLLLSQYAPQGRRLAHSIIPNWERADLFPADADAATSPNNNPMPDELRGRFVVLYLGNAGHGHEFQTLMDAAELVRDEPVTFLFVGGGALRPWIEQQANERHLPNIMLHDYIPKQQTPALMRSVGCALITLQDSMLGVMSPSKLHANLAMGLPVIYVGPRGSNVDEAIARYGCGASLRPGEAGAMAAFIREITSNPAKLAELRFKARQAFEQAYCDAKTLPAFDAILDALAVAGVRHHRA